MEVNKMGFFSRQFANVVEWQEFRDDMIFYKWSNNEIKKGSRLIIRPGQDAIFLYNGKIEGIFKDEGDYDIESQIIPFLSTLKGFKFGFNSGIRAEVLFVNARNLSRNKYQNAIIFTPTTAVCLSAKWYVTFKVETMCLLIMCRSYQSYTVEDVRLAL